MDMHEHWGTKQPLSNEMLELVDAFARQRGDGHGLGKALFHHQVADRALLLRRRCIDFGQHHVRGLHLIKTVGFVILAFQHLSPRRLEFSSCLEE